MSTFETAVEFVLSQEGGLSDDPNDNGSLTNFGISQRSYRDLDIRKLTREDAIGIYKRDYWNRCQCDNLPPVFAVILFDAAVNQGVLAACRLFQYALAVRTDGVIGPQTIQAATTAPIRKTVNEFIARRMNAYGLNPQFMRYGLGWSRRVAQIHELALEIL